MLAWALRYLAVAIVVGGGFAILQGESGPWLDRATSARAAKPGSAQATRRTTSADEAWDHVVEAGTHGHFVIEAVVNGEPIRFLVDTGASDVVLTPEDAEALGFAQRRLDFSLRYNTANGVVRAAPVSLREVRIGQFSLYDVQAAVNEAPLGISLLGMSFLERLAGYQVDDGRLALRW
jgi:aspartyl protease family protein